MKTVLAFDFGASTGRAVKAVCGDGKIEYNEIHRFDNIPLTDNGHIRHNVTMISEEIKKAVEKAGKIDSLAFDTWGVDYALLDENGELIAMPYHYRDPRTAQAVEKALKIMPADKLYELTGNQIMNINTLFQLMCDENLNKAKTLLFMPDLFAYLLCKKAVCEKTIASTSQLMNPLTQSWSREVLERFNISESLFAPLCDCGEICGDFNGIKVVSVAGHDTQCAVAAMVCPGENTAFLSCGTWSLIGCETDRPFTDEKSCRYELSNEIGANSKINYLKNISGLWLIQEVRRNFGEAGKNYTYNDMENLALESNPFYCFIDPDDKAFSLPGEIPEKIIEFCRRTGQRVPRSDGEIIRCIYESLAMKYRYALGQISECTGRRFEKLNILGGGTKDKLLCSMTADSTGLKVVAGPVEATALGNIIIQLKALGEIKSIDEGRKLIASYEKTMEYEPVQTEEWNKAYKEFLKIIDR